MNLTSKAVHDERIFGDVSAVIRVDGYDETNTPTSAKRDAMIF